jgi:aminomethyltransferase
LPGGTPRVTFSATMPDAIMQTAGRPVFAQPLLRTPFHARAREAATTDAFIPWSGYTTVDVFTTVEQEYFAIRNNCSVYDLTPMVKYSITGPDAEPYLNRLLTRDVRALKNLRVAYSIWCNDEGHVIDDGTLFRLSEDNFRLCAAERQLDWLTASAIGFDVRIEEVTARIAALSLQGPTSAYVLKTLGCAGIENLRRFAIADFAIGTIPLTISRTGFTGDLGYELWMPPDHAIAIWDRLMHAGKDAGIRPIGSQALNMARIEAGFVMPHHEFVSAESILRPGRARTPFELGLDWLVNFEKPHFTGKRALHRHKHDKTLPRLVALDVAGNKPAADALLYTSKSCRREIGYVTSAIWSPTCKRNIALGYVPQSHAALGREVHAEIYLNREARWERRVVPARVVERPFFAPDRARRTPAADR